MGCFHILALQVMLQNIYVLWEYMLSNLLGVYFISVRSYGNSVFIFFKELSNFFKVVSSFYILVSNVWRFQFFLHPYQHIAFLTSGYEVTSDYSFDFHFPND